jgi:hypothetical protein
VLRQPRASLSTRDLARIYGVTTKSIRDWTRAGWLPAPTMRHGEVRSHLPRCFYRATTSRWTVGDLVRCYLW